MPSIHLSALAFGYSSAIPILSSVDLDIGSGWSGLVGANGAGKSTLLSLIAGDVVPTAGSIGIVAASPPILCTQRVDEPGYDIPQLAQRWDGDAARLRALLELDPDDLPHWDVLSPGQRKRWQVGAALAQEPDVLLLDEPTNHLDRNARDILLRALRRFDGVGLIVSHDRQLLDELTVRTLRLHDGDVQRWEGGYSAAREQWAKADAGRRAAHDAARAQERKLRRQLDQARRERAAAEASGARERRIAGHRDHDAHSMGKSVVAGWAEQSLAKSVAARKTKLQRAQQATAAIGVRRSHAGPIALESGDGGGRWLAQLDADVVCAGDAPLLHDVHVAVAAGERIRIAGVNGAGKTTLLHRVVDAATAPEHVVLLPQELSAEATRRAADELRAMPPAQRGEVLSLVARLGAEPAHLLASEQLSPGEARKVALATMLARQPRLVALDEPTNHLDLPSIEAVEEALDRYDGALLLITHDDQFAARTTTIAWHVADGAVNVVR